jgi:hypothetical protein
VVGSTIGVAAGLVGDLERLILAASRSTSSGSSNRKVAAFGPCMPGSGLRKKVRRRDTVGCTGDADLGVCTGVGTRVDAAIASTCAGTKGAILSGTSIL